MRWKRTGDLDLCFEIPTFKRPTSLGFRSRSCWSSKAASSLATRDVMGLTLPGDIAALRRSHAPSNTWNRLLTRPVISACVVALHWPRRTVRLAGRRPMARGRCGGQSTSMLQSADWAIRRMAGSSSTACRKQESSSPPPFGSDSGDRWERGEMEFEDPLADGRYQYTELRSPAKATADDSPGAVVVDWVVCPSPLPCPL